ncbi:hypothetical protein HELRODRAFT_72755 [Helobdella robusta]|uniref:glutathione gamma-glutamylcysteinyltransferase n=1 Tax=Helobdella robusta TaxID=6412 RepID=T1G149_HELRO|nr:hypothetical protein HELRODRAFT_72755 [Helobdella robusta]ESO10002.1 hypothetical protein HELRODRAFT_72755 [Helobdella robusta]
MADSCWNYCGLEYFPSLITRSSSDICCNFQYNNNNISNQVVEISTSFNSNYSSSDCTCVHYDKTATSLDHNVNPAEQPVNFYKRELPKCCISFCSDDGKKIFQEAVVGPFMNCYFSLASQFRTQDEPAYCGLSTLVMVLNALEVDPNRVWKGPWRWYHENMLDCCVPLAIIEKKGITMDQFSCLAACNMLKTKVTRVDGNSSEETFRKLVKSVTQKTNCILVTSYSRVTLQQTGDGHFSPIGGYNVERDMVLIMDTARFKYPPHWVSLSLLFKAMQRLDPSCDLPRGYILLSRNELNPGLLFRLSSYFSPIGLDSRLRYFFKSWDNVLSIDLTNVDCVGIDAAEMAVVQIIRLLGQLENGIHLMTAQINAKYAEKVLLFIVQLLVFELTEFKNCFVFLGGHENLHDKRASVNFKF